jgi:hypothetical protein
MSSLADRLSRLLEQLEFAAGGGARFRGAWCTVDEAGDARLAASRRDGDADAEGDARTHDLRRWLADHMYVEWHCGIPESALRRVHVTDPVATRDFVRTLSAANATDESWEAGWVVADVQDARVTAAARHGVRFVVSPDGVRASDVTPGATCLVQLDGEQRNMLPGFYLALGAHTPAVAPQEQLRVYWHLRSTGAAPLLSALSRSLNLAGIPYWLKLLSDPSDYNRNDAAVLYLTRQDMAAAALLVMEVYAAVRQHLRPATSPFALTIAPGLAVAVDLPRSASFGQHRSQALANAIVMVANDALPTGGRIATRQVLEALHAQGVDPAATYRHADDSDPDGWTAWLVSPPAVVVTGDVAPGSNPATDDHTRALDVAGDIADWICGEAFVHDGMWNWMGADVTVDDDMVELHMTYRALGPSMYDGTSGIALFLAEAFAATGNTRLADAARGAMRHALSRIDEIPADMRRCFHTGVAGIAWVAARLGTLFGDRTMEEKARTLALQVAADEAPPPLLDVISGAAGTAVALLSLADDLSLDELRAAAQRLGAAICAGASRTGRGWSWGASASGAEFARDLTGFAHGAGGIGWSLLEVGIATGTEEFVRGAREAMRYEDSWYSAEDENWPDFRDSDGRETPAPSMMAWCHGAPGIMLSRLRACRLLGDGEARTDLERGMRSTLRWLADPDVAAETSFTLCHGLLGVAECVEHGAAVLDDDGARAAARAVASHGRLLHARDPASWTPGLRRGRNPSLMLGQAGIGLSYLRMAKPDIPSVLLWNPRAAR